MDSGELREPELPPRAPSRFAPASSVVHTRQAAPRERHLVLRDPALRATPRAPPGPQACHRRPGHGVPAIAVVIPRLCPPAMTDAGRRLAPRCQAAGEGGCLRVHPGARGQRRVAPRLDGPWLDVFPPAPDRVTTALEPPAPRGLLRGACAPAALPLAAAPPATPPCCPTASGGPWWPAPLEAAAHAPASGTVGAGVLRPRPWRHGPGIGCPSSGWRSRAWAMGWVDRVRPRPYRPRLHTRRGCGGPAQRVAVTSSTRRAPA